MLFRSVGAAKAETSRPSIISLRTVIGFPSPTKADTGGIHGSKLGGSEVAGLKTVLGFDPEESFAVADEVLANARSVQERGTASSAAWQATWKRIARACQTRHWAHKKTHQQRPSKTAR